MIKVDQFVQAIKLLWKLILHYHALYFYNQACITKLADF
jgi:hypothetical protein